MRYVNSNPSSKGKHRSVRGVNSSASKKKFSFPVKTLFIVGGLLLLGLLFLPKLNVFSFLRPLSVFSQIINPSSLAKTDGRTNVLILGLDLRSEASEGSSSVLSDTIIIGSLPSNGRKMVLISVPRDLWVPLGDNYSGKINSAYSLLGIEETKKVLENVTGIPVHYYLLVGFEGFEKAIDTLGGVEIEVARSFDDFYYPIAGREQWECPEDSEKPPPVDDGEVGEGVLPETAVFHPCRYEQVHFEAGWQVMDGATALKYARSRHALGEEGSDFARADRQQKVILAVKEKALSWETLSNPTKLKELYDTYRAYVQTDISLPVAEKFLDVSRQVDQNQVTSYVLGTGVDESGRYLLVAPTERGLYSNQYVLIPRVGDFSSIRAWVQKNLFGE